MKARFSHRQDKDSLDVIFGDNKFYLKAYWYSGNAVKRKEGQLILEILMAGLHKWQTIEVWLSRRFQMI